MIVRHRLARAIAAGAALLLARAAGAQSAPPGTDIFLAPLTMRDGALTVGTPANITARPGYDNQPSFTPDGAAILYTSVREDAQADIYRYDLRTGATTRLTRTPESEYSPAVMPDGRSISVVRVEADSTQRLWRFSLKGDRPKLVLERVKPVGYYVWGDARTLLLFVLGTPATLVRADARTGAVSPVIENPGRSLQRIPGESAVSFVRKRAHGENWVMRYDLPTGSFLPLVRALPESEDHAWTPRRTLLMARGNRLYAWTAPADGGDGEWREIAAFGDPAMARITRLAVSPAGDRIAIVAEPAPEAEP
ncbi:MAG TPA: hypothetical protein VFS05_01465 [Gemmatimonadaceae bacterium]|nr:hypothetical protein [Gemmatimonadaceae bacterium]